MKTLKLFSLLLVAVFNFASPAAKFQKCDTGNNVNQCLSQSVHQLIKHDLPNIDPLVLPKEVVLEFGDALTGVHQKYSNFKVTGFTGVTNTKTNLDLDKKIVTLELTFPELHFLTDYEAQGKVIFLPIDTSTKSDITLATNSTPALSCDFERDDLCGWSHDLNHNFDWIRLNFETPSGNIGTGPRYDHTKGPGHDGYYMYIEASARRPNDTARLISPVYDKSDNTVCFEFYYHMYGITMGSLRVYLKKVNEAWNLNPQNALFVKEGNQGNKWYRGFIIFGKIETDYQIIIEGVRGTSYVSDIAIDDVRVIKDCVPEDEIREEETTTEEASSEAPPTIESCENRCNSYDNQTSNLLITCDCDENCYDRNRCCPDYFDFCVSGTTDVMEETTEYVSSAVKITTSKATTTSKIPMTTQTKVVPKTTVIPTTTERKTVAPTTTIVPKTTQRKTTLVLKTTLKPTPRTTVRPKTTITPETTVTPKTTPSTRSTSRVTTSPDKKEESKIIYVKPNEDYDEIQVTPPVEKETPAFPIKETELINDYDTDKTFDHQKIEVTSNIHESNTKTIVFAVGVIFGVLFAMVGMAFVARRYQLCHCRRMRLNQSSNGDSQSDVRFLTSDEILDFSLAGDYDTL